MASAQHQLLFTNRRSILDLRNNTDILHSLNIVCKVCVLFFFFFQIYYSCFPGGKGTKYPCSYSKFTPYFEILQFKILTVDQITITIL